LHSIAQHVIRVVGRTDCSGTTVIIGLRTQVMLKVMNIDQRHRTSPHSIKSKLAVSPAASADGATHTSNTPGSTVGCNA